MDPARRLDRTSLLPLLTGNLPMFGPHVSADRGWGLRLPGLRAGLLVILFEG